MAVSGKWNVTSLPAQAMLVKQCDTREAAAPKDPDMHTDNDRQSLPDRGERVALADTFSSTRHTVQHIEKSLSRHVLRVPLTFCGLRVIGCGYCGYCG